MITEQSLADSQQKKSVKESAGDSPTRPLYLSRLSLQFFRNYTHTTLELNEKPVMITGHNGAGKTNILEAVSFLTAGKGLRKASLETIDQQNTSHNGWSVHGILQKNNREYRIGTGRDTATNKRKIHLDGDEIKQSELADITTIIWLTPQMDGIFLSSNSERRRFLDRMVYHFDPEHAKRINRYEHYIRERMQCLHQQADNHWIQIIEQHIAELSIAIAVARNETIARIQLSLEKATTIFPKATLIMEGEIEQALLKQAIKALDLEEHIMQQLLLNRSSDRLRNRTQYGVHKSTLRTLYNAKNMHAEYCSTGEQKALLLSIILAEVRAHCLFRHTVPIVLLDEVIAHLDEDFRQALFEEILQLQSQCWMTGTDANIFSSVASKVQSLHVEHSGITAS